MIHHPFQVVVALAFVVANTYSGFGIIRLWQIYISRIVLSSPRPQRVLLFMRDKPSCDTIFWLTKPCSIGSGKNIMQAVHQLTCRIHHHKRNPVKLGPLNYVGKNSSPGIYFGSWTNLIQMVKDPTGLTMASMECYGLGLLKLNFNCRSADTFQNVTWSSLISLICCFSCCCCCNNGGDDKIRRHR